MRPALQADARLRSLIFVLIAACGAAEALQAGRLDGRHAAIDRALSFVYATASNDANFAKYGSDMLWCFYSISHTARDPELRATTARMGRELAERWRRSHQHVPADATAHDIYLLVSGSYAAEKLGFPDARFKSELRQAARRFTAKDYLGFDAAREPPRPDDPKRYDTWCGALLTTFFGDAYGIRLGARYRDVVKWLPRFHPYEGDDADLEFDSFYATTHLIYTLDRYHERRIAPSLLPDEFNFLRRKLDDAIEDADPEMVGEALDCLKAGGYENDPQVAKGMEYLISSQRPDGPWAGDQDDVYTEFHSAWTSIDGLRNYHFHGRVEKLPGH